MSLYGIVRVLSELDTSFATVFVSRNLIITILDDLKILLAHSQNVWKISHYEGIRYDSILPARSVDKIVHFDYDDKVCKSFISCIQ